MAHVQITPAPSLARRRGRRRRPQRADRRADPARAVARAGRPSGAGVSRPVPDARPVSRRRVGVRAADGAALLAAQHAGLPPDRADLAPERPAAGRAVAHRPHQPRAPAGRHHPVRGGDSLGRRRHQRGEHARGLRRAAGGRAPAPRVADDVQQPGRGHTDTRQEDRDKYGKPIEHPMVRTHPVHGSRAVYFHISKATHIDGMTPEASRAYMARSARPDDPAGDRLSPRLAQGRRAGHRRPRDDAPRARRLRPEPEPGAVADHRRGRSPAARVSRPMRVDRIFEGGPRGLDGIAFGVQDRRG